ncbi:RraA family protein [Bauldia sp.]|uniref:RraA family protein n=1 Tax=Bauldia sp. TaxID=2575872 RepID=UPI003BAABE82
MSDKDLFATIRDRLFTAVIGDVMDNIGLHHQFLPPEVRALQETVIVGRAMPVQITDVGDDDPGDAYGLLFRALDNLKPGEVYMAAGGSPDYALWGGLMSIRAMHLEAAGAIMEGHHRDTREIRQLGFPVYSLGAYAQDQKDRGSVVDFRCPITFSNGVKAAPGDVIVADIDGVVVIPKDALDEVIAAALAKVDGEDNVRKMIEAGETTEEIFAKTGIM